MFNIKKHSNICIEPLYFVPFVGGIEIIKIKIHQEWLNVIIQQMTDSDEKKHKIVFYLYSFKTRKLTPLISTSK